MSMDRQTVTSVGNPEIQSSDSKSLLSIELAAIGLDKFPPPASRTFRNWNKTPWILNSRTSINLAKFENLAVTFVKTTDISTGIQVVFGTVLANQSSLGFRPNNYYLKIRILILNDNDGLLEEWQVSQNHSFSCTSQNEPFTYRATFKPDWFELAEKVFVIVEPVTWLPCK